MSLEENKAIVKRHVEAWNDKNPTVAIDELLATDHVDHGIEAGDNGIDALRQLFTEQLNDRPDRHYTIVDMVAEGDKVMVMLVQNHTDKSTGEQCVSTGINLYRIKGGKLQEAWSVWQKGMQS